ncbi:VOC family protein [Actinokineospora sp. PR83]|uniref:VOC family protein n=1 Tax=Actinokineospora sp. PR83 TaxID=2884908 RepID=UPI001F258E00|nr:VOC family protein [Actinokineospora sp. PR83]MCG8920361.1 VOC family protein [Actinokineospora sp. PR83]
MAIRIDLTLDCAHPTPLAAFYKAAFGYEDEPPPAPFATRAEWVASFPEDPADDADDGAWLHDPEGVGPRIFFQQVKEPKVGKVRLHLDFRVAGTGAPEERWARIRAAAERVEGLGARRLADFDGHHVVLADPEGNEFCLG